MATRYHVTLEFQVLLHRYVLDKPEIAPNSPTCIYLLYDDVTGFRGWVELLRDMLDA